MIRREFIMLLGGAAVTWPIAARAQPPERMRRIGVLMNMAADDPTGLTRLLAFAQALAQAGWTDGRNVRIELSWRTRTACPPCSSPNIGLRRSRRRVHDLVAGLYCRGLGGPIWTGGLLS